MSGIPPAAEREKVYADAGIHPDEVPPPDGPVRASFGPLTVIGQGCGTLFFGAVGLAGLVLAACSWLFPPPGMFVALGLGMTLAAGMAALIYFVTRNDYLWVEIDGRVITAKHMYTGAFVVREAEEVAEVRTIVLPGGGGGLVGWMLGRVKGWVIVFRDDRAPLQIVRSDPAMKNACLFMEALFHAMKQVGPVRAEEVGIDGGPLVLRVTWDRKPTPPPTGPKDERLRGR